MKKILVFLLALVMVFAMAACGEEKAADVIAGSDAKDTVIETPTPAPQPPIISDNTTPTPDYPSVDVLPPSGPVTDPGTGAATVTTPATTAPSTSANTGTAVGVPIPTKDPSTAGTETGTTGTGETTQQEITFADDSGEMYYPTASDWDKQHAKIGYTNVLHANLRVGPGTQYKIYESLRKNAELRIISIEGQWAKVWYDGIILGYIYKDYVTFGTPPTT